MTNTVFFSWQSDLYETRTVVQGALRKAITNLNRDLALEEALRLDEDTSGVAGWPEITSTLLGKIDQCEVFVADITPSQWPVFRFQTYAKPERAIRARIRTCYRFGQDTDRLRRQRSVSS